MKSEYFVLFLNDNKSLGHRIKNKRVGHNINAPVLMTESPKEESYSTRI